MTRVTSCKRNSRPSQASRRRQKAFQVTKMQYIRQEVCKSFVEEEKSLADTKKELDKVKEQVVCKERFWKDQLDNRDKWWNARW